MHQQGGGGTPPPAAPDIFDTLAQKTNPAVSRDQLEGWANTYAAKHSVDPALVKAVMQQESQFNSGAVSPKGAIGPMQLMPATAKQLIVDPNHPEQNVEGGTRYLSQLLKRYGGDTQKALAAYNAGPGAVDKAGGIPNFPETQNYVRQVMARYQPEDIRKEGQQMAMKDASQTSGMLAKNVLVPVAQAGAALATGGMSIPAQMGINAAIEGGLQGAGINEPSKTQLALSALGPLAGKVVQKGVREGVAATGRFMNGPAVRSAGVEAAAKVMGQEPNLMTRALNPKASKALYDVAEQGGFIPAAQAHTAVQNALRQELQMANPDAKTVQTLQGLANKYAPGTAGTLMVDSADLLKEAQRLGRETTGAFRTGQNVTAQGMKDATAGLKAAIPGVTEADQAYTKEKVAGDIFKRMRIGNQQAKIDQYIEDNGSKMLGAGFSQKDIQEIRDIAKRIGPATAAPVGATNRALDAIAKPVSEMILDAGGRKILRLVMGPESKISPAGINAALTFWRGYQASKARDSGGTISPDSLQASQ